MNWAEIKTNDIANGEGVRTSLFVSGCRHHCKNCFNEITWDFSYGHLFTEETMEDIFKSVDHSWINGISLLGGEPFEPENQKVLVPFLVMFHEKFPDKTVWRFEKTEVTDRYGTRYIQLTAADVTDLQRALVQLTADSKKLQEDTEKLKQLSDNAGALAREKELLDAKSAMHDGLAACITLTKQYITGEFDGMDPGVVCHEWEKVIAFRDTIRLPARKKLLDSAKASGVTVRIRGQEPTDGEAELLYTAMQVCLNNAIQYAKATEISANIWENEGSYTVVIRNNGKPPEKEITEGGGLTNLRHRIENSGGKMTVQSLPRFSLAIEIPKSGNSGVNNL